jgi:hypothetical protein
LSPSLLQAADDEMAKDDVAEEEEESTEQDTTSSGEKMGQNLVGKVGTKLFKDFPSSVVK